MKHQRPSASYATALETGALSIFALVLMITALALWEANAGPADNRVDWISLSPAGKILYGEDDSGNRIPDFSTAGYQAGERTPPIVPVAQTIAGPSGGDDTGIIQAALDELAGRPVGVDGFRGALELGPGTYMVRGELRLSASGVVLRGAGIGRTKLSAEGRPRTLLKIGGDGSWLRDGEATRILGAYVPVGAQKVSVQEVTNFRTGDRVIVQRPTTREWITQIGMDEITPRAHGKTRQWQPGPGLLFDRTVVGIEGNALVLDAALTNGLAEADGSVVWRYRFDGRIRNVGVEQLSASGAQFFADPDYGRATYRDSRFASFDAVEDAWVRNVAIDDFSIAFSFRRSAKRITASDFQATNMESPRVRAPPPMVSIAGQQILVSNCGIRGQNFSAWVTQSLAAGPNVVLRCTATGKRLSGGTHQRWATGVLFDSISLEGRLHIGNRGNLGTGQGWAGANSVVWNSDITAYLVERPPTANNWAFGVVGKVLRTNEPLGVIESPGQNVEPKSLFDHQLKDRLAPR